MLSVPLVCRDRVVGTLNFRSKDRSAYSGRDQVVAEQVAAQIAPAIENAQLHEATRRLAAESAALAEIGRIISASHDIGEVYERFAEQVRRLVPFDRIAITTVDFERETTTVSHAYGETLPGREPGSVHPLAGTATETVLQSRAGLLINVESEQALARKLLAYTTSIEAGFRSLISVPLISGDHVVGALHLRSRTPNAYTERQFALAEQVGAQIAEALALGLERSRLFREVSDARSRLQDLSRQLVEAQEAERRNVARELHDEIGQALTALNLNIEIIRRLGVEAGSARLDEVQSLTADLIGRVRELSLDLRPPMLDDLGLLPALLWHMERFMDRTNVRVTFEHSGLKRRFATEIEITAYRVVQEALTNVARHAGADEVVVSAHANRDSLRLQIRHTSLDRSTTPPLEPRPIETSGDHRPTRGPAPRRPMAKVSCVRP